MFRPYQIMFLSLLLPLLSIAAPNMTSIYVRQCMAKIIENIQPCSDRVVVKYNLNHTHFVPSKLSTCCANYEMFQCFVQSSLESCSLPEFKAIVDNVTADAFSLEKHNCSRFKYRSDACLYYLTDGSHSSQLNFVFFTSFLSLSLSILNIFSSRFFLSQWFFLFLLFLFVCFSSKFLILKLILNKFLLKLCA